VNPATAGTLGNAKAVLHVFTGAVIDGAAGNMTTLTTFDRQVLGVFATVLPQADASTYLACIIWQPAVVGIVGAEDQLPLSMLYSTLNPVTGVTAGKINAALQVFAGAISTGAAGYTTKLFVSAHPGPGVLYVAVKHPAVVGVKTPVEALIVPPPLTVHVPAAAPPDCVNVTVPPPMQEFTVVTAGS
jgi:hypothetical protein